MKCEITHGKIIELVHIEIGNTGEKCIFDLKYMYNVESFDVYCHPNSLKYPSGHLAKPPL